MWLLPFLLFCPLGLRSSFGSNSETAGLLWLHSGRNFDCACKQQLGALWATSGKVFSRKRDQNMFFVPKCLLAFCSPLLKLAGEVVYCRTLYLWDCTNAWLFTRCACGCVYVWARVRAINKIFSINEASGFGVLATTGFRACLAKCTVKLNIDKMQMGLTCSCSTHA